MHVQIVIEKIIRTQKIKGPLPKGWNLRSIANFAENTLPIRKQNKEKLGGRELYAIEPNYFSPSWAGEGSIK